MKTLFQFPFIFNKRIHGFVFLLILLSLHLRGRGQSSLPTNSTGITFSSSGTSGGWSWSLNSSNSGLNDVALTQTTHFVDIFTTGADRISFNIASTANSPDGNLLVYNSTSTATWGTAVLTISSFTTGIRAVALDPAKPYVRIQRTSGVGRIELNNIYLIGNDNCVNATNITIDAAAISGSLTGASFESPNTSKSEVWYKFTPTCTGDYTITLSGLPDDKDLYVYTGNCGSVSQLQSSTNLSTTNEVITRSFTAGITYCIQVYDYANTGGSFNIRVTGPSITAPSISAHPNTSSASTCQNGSAFTAISITASGTSLSYQWQSSSAANGSSGWTNVGSNSNSFTPPNSTIGTLYYRCVVSNCIGSVNSNVSGAITVTSTLGDQTSYGTSSWIGYVYNSSSAGAFTTYKGYVTESENFDRDMSTGSAVGATTNVCSGNSDLFAIRYKMTKSYTAGIYKFVIGADDGVRLSVDGGVTWLINDWSNHGYRTSSASVYLSGSTNLVLEYYENTGSARVSVYSFTNDECSGAQQIGIDSSPINANFYGASSSGGAYEYNDRPDIWFKFTTQCPGNYTITSSLSSYDVDFYLYENCGSTLDLANDLLETAANNETHTISLQGNTTYYIRANDFDSYYSTFSIQITSSQTNLTVNAGTDAIICRGSNTTLNGSINYPITIFSENFESYTAGTLAGSGSSWKQTEISSTVTYWQINTSCVPPQGSKCLNMNDTYGVECDYAWDDAGDEIAWFGTRINASNYTNLKINFKWRAMGQTNIDYGLLVYSTDGTNWNNVSSTKYQGQISWQTVSNLAMPAALDGQSFYLGFRWINDGNTGAEPGFNIDDISITGETSISYSWSPSASLSAGNISNPIASPTVTTVYTLTVSANGCSGTDQITVTFNEPITSTSLASTDYVWRGVTNSDWNTASNWVTYNGSAYSVANAAPTATSTPNVIIPATSTNCPVSNFPNTGSSTVYGKNVTIEPSASVTMGNGIMNVSGNFTNNGTFTCGTGTVNFNGTSTQTINTSNTRETFYNLTTDKSAGQLQLNDSVQVNNLLTLTNGKITTTSANLLTLLINATYNASTTIGSASSYVNGPMAYKISSTAAQSLKFPLGNINDWRPVEVNVTHNSTTPYTYTAQMYNGSANALGWTLPTGFERVSHVHYVDVERSPSSTNNLSAATIKMYYSNTNGTDDGVSNYQNLSIAKASISGSVWSDIGGLGTATANSVGSITSNNFTSFSRFSLSNKSGGTNPLPVELTDFTAACNNQQVKLNWTTQSELNNDYFGVERSADGLLFHEIGRVAGHGNSNVENHYQYFDEQALAGTSYYRLNQVDFNRDSKLYPVKAVGCDDEQHEIVIYPNPNSGDFEISGLSEGNCIDVFDVLGKKVISTLSKSSKEKLQLSGIKPGVYFVVIKNTSGKTNTQKLVIEQ